MYSALCEIPLSATNGYWFGSFIPRERARKVSRPDFPTKDRGLDTRDSQIGLPMEDQGPGTKDPQADLWMKERGLGTKGSRVDL